MSIEYYCNHCGQFLKVPEQIAGKTAECPHCRTVQTVPGPEVFRAEPATPEPTAPERAMQGEPQNQQQNQSQQQANPAYQSYPQQQTWSPNQPDYHHVEPSEPVLTKISLFRLFEDSWSIFVARIQQLLLMGVIGAGLVMAGVFSMYIFSVVLSLVMLPMLVQVQPGQVQVRKEHAPGMVSFTHELESQSKEDAEKSNENAKIQESDVDANAKTIAEEHAASEPVPFNPFENLKEGKNPWEQLERELARNQHEFGNDPRHQPDIDPAALAVFFAVWMTSMGIIAMILSLVYLWIFAGQVDYTLQLVRGGNPSFGVLFGGLKHFMKVLYIAAWIGIYIILAVTFFSMFPLFGSIMAYVFYNPDPNNAHPLGIFMLIASFIIFSLIAFFAVVSIQILYGSSYYFAIDRNAGVSESMRLSRQHSRPNYWSILGALILLAIANAVIGMIPFAIVVTMPFTLVFSTVLYLSITGQKNCISP